MSAGRSLQRYGGALASGSSTPGSSYFRCHQGPWRPAIFHVSGDTRCGILRYETRKHPSLSRPPPLLFRNSPIQSPTSPLQLRNSTLQNARLFPGFVDFSGNSATIRTRIHRYTARQDRGGGRGFTNNARLGRSGRTRLESYPFRRQSPASFTRFSPILDSRTLGSPAATRMIANPRRKPPRHRLARAGNTPLDKAETLILACLRSVRDSNIPRLCNGEFRNVTDSFETELSLKSLKSSLILSVTFSEFTVSF
jgi:hypothetical protein